LGVFVVEHGGFTAEINNKNPSLEFA